MPKWVMISLVITFVAIGVATILFMNQSADEAREQSDKIMQEFKNVDKDLQQLNPNHDSLNKIVDSLIRANK